MNITLNEIRSKAPNGATHYVITMKNNIRYYTKDWNGDWGIYQDWKYPIGWRKVGIFFDESEIKPL